MAQLPRLPKAQVLAGAAQRNTAPAIGLAAHILRSLDPECRDGVFPADHVVSRPAVYRSVCGAAFRGAARRTSDGGGDSAALAGNRYGYIEFPRRRPGRNARSLSGEAVPRKPGAGAAKRYVAAGNFYWNSGMFFWRAGVLRTNCGSICRRTATLLASLPRFGSRQFAARLARAFPLCDNISIDYAVMEKAGNVRGIAKPRFRLEHVGSWTPSMSCCPADGDGTWWPASGLPGRAMQLRRRPRQKMAGAGRAWTDLIVIDTPTLCFGRRDLAQQVGDVVKALERRKREDLLYEWCRCPTCGKKETGSPGFPLSKPGAEARADPTTGAFSSYRLSEFAIRGGGPPPW